MTTKGEFIWTNSQLVLILKEYLGKTGDFDLVVQFGLGATTVRNEKGESVPAAINQVVGVGITPKITPLTEQGPMKKDGLIL